ncbi:MFS transporter [Streptomyces calidiresistens]
MTLESAPVRQAPVPLVTPPGFVPRLGLANLGLYAALLTPVVVTMALRVDQVAPDNREATLGVVLSAGALVALIVNPLAGRLSDRTRSRFGRRVPWLVGGVAVGVLGLLIIAAVPAVPALVLGWCLVQGGFNAVYAALMATIPDRVAPDDRGKASGAIGTTITVAVLIGSGIAAVITDVRVMLLLPTVLTVLLVGWFVLFLRRVGETPGTPGTGPADSGEGAERPLLGKDTAPLPAAPLVPDPAATAPPFSFREFLGSFVFNPVRHPDFGWAWLTKFLVMFGAVAPLSYLAFYVAFRMDLTVAEVAGTVAGLVAINYAVQSVTAALGGWLSDRLGRRKPLVIASGLIVAAGLGILAVAPSPAWILVAQLVAGLGGGLFYAVDMALITEVLPDPDNAAKDLGVINIANALPQSLMPMIAPFVLAVGGGENYSLLFGIAAGSAVLGSVLVTRIRGAR